MFTTPHQFSWEIIIDKGVKMKTLMNIQATVFIIPKDAIISS